MRFLTLILIFFVSALRAQQPAPAIELSSADKDSLTAMAYRAGFSGTLVIVQNGKEIFTYSGGLADESTGRYNDPDTRFNQCSNGKTLTAILVLQAVEAGRLKLDEPVAPYMPKGTALPNAARITIRQLLNHTSGLGDFFEHPKFSDSLVRTIDQHYQLVTDMKPVSDTPGSKFHYSNSGFIVLGKVLETVYRHPYQELVQERILTPAGITGGKGKAYSTGYAQKDGRWERGEGNEHRYWTSAGGIFLSPREMNVLLQALNSGKYLSNESRRQLWSKESRPEPGPPFVHYGLGWMVEDPGGLTLLGHNGGVRGFQCAFRYLPSENISFYLCSNRDGGGERLFMQTLFLLMKKKGIEPPR
ncbi:MAG TPA: serine hydrolase domain-containing protein [Chitinophagaceae bacterium]|nr:serine hydrolase domain-containing protein [Chitinophagaceae bacterium]